MKYIKTNFTPPKKKFNRGLLPTNFYITVNNEKQSRKLQNLLFEAKFRWAGGETTPLYTNSTFLIIECNTIYTASNHTCKSYEAKYNYHYHRYTADYIIQKLN